MLSSRRRRVFSAIGWIQSTLRCHSSCSDICCNGIVCKTVPMGPYNISLVEDSNEIDLTCKLLHSGDLVVSKENNTSLSKSMQFLRGRIALRRSFQRHMDNYVFPIPRDSDGAPILPNNIIGSISHRNNISIACSKPRTDNNNIGLGIDLEDRSRVPSSKFANRILTYQELDNARNSNFLSFNDYLLLLFSIKESSFKSIHPLLRRYVEFKEVEVFPSADGTAKVLYCLKSNEKIYSRCFWLSYDSQLISLVDSFSCL